MTDTPSDIPPVLAAAPRRQDHVISRQQALAAGMSKEALRHRLRRGGPWQRLLPGVYLTVTGVPTADQREMAALLFAGPGSVITGLAALRREGVRARDNGLIAVLIPAGRKRRSVGFVHVARTTRMPGQVVAIGARQYAMPDRAVADAARGMTSLTDVRTLVAAAVQARRCRIDMLTAELIRGPARGSTRLRLALAEVAAGIRSGAEGDLRDLLMRSHIPAPMFNPLLYDAAGGLVASPDAWWPDAGVAAEVDSREWHLAPDDWQLTMARHAAMTAHGILVLHFSPKQIRNEPGDIIPRITAALAVGRTRPRLPIRAVPAGS
jgi:hypothetical protein